MTTEQWRDIPGYEGLYEVSDHGRVRSMHGRRGSAVHMLNPGRTNGYLMVGLCKNKNKWQVTVHRLVMLAFVGESNGLFTNHKDGNRSNNHLSNLEYVTNVENLRHGREVLGHLPGKRSLDESVIREIIELGANGLKPKQIAQMFEITVQHTRLILRGETWMHLTNREVVRRGYREGYGKKIDAETVEQIIALRNAGWKLQPIADRFGVDIAHVSRICSGKARTYHKSQERAS